MNFTAEISHVSLSASSALFWLRAAPAHEMCTFIKDETHMKESKWSAEMMMAIASHRIVAADISVSSKSTIRLCSILCVSAVPSGVVTLNPLRYLVLVALPE